MVLTASNLLAQRTARRVVVDKTSTCGCIVNHDPNRPMPTMVSGGILNGKALILPQPRFGSRRPKHGRVSVQVIVAEDGSVVKALGVSGSNSVKPAAEEAALLARFPPTLLSGHPVKVSGLIWYKY